MAQHGEVERFLDSIGMAGKYKEVFIDNGVEDLETVLELDDKHLEIMGVPLGHKLKIMKKIKEIRQERGLYVAPSRHGSTRDKLQPSNLKQQQH